MVCTILSLFSCIIISKSAPPPCMLQAVWHTSGYTFSSSPCNSPHRKLSMQMSGILSALPSTRLLMDSHGQSINIARNLHSPASSRLQVEAVFTSEWLPEDAQLVCRHHHIHLNECAAGPAGILVSCHHRPLAEIYRILSLHGLLKHPNC
jgi:hypothetical protein